MIIKRTALKAALVATTDERSRYFLHAVRIHPDGTVEATDSHMLIRIKDRHPAVDADFPQLPGVGEITGTFKRPILIPADLTERLIAATPKKHTIPILTSIQVGTDKDARRLALATDLQVPCVANLEPCNTTQTFPRTDRVMVQDGQRPQMVTLTLSAAMLAALVKIATTLGRAKSENAVTFEIPTGPEYQDTRQDEGGTQVPTGRITSSVRITMTGDDCDLEGVIMPCRL